MIRCIKAELWKAIHNPLLWAALGIGTLIAMLNVMESVSTVQSITATSVEHIEQTGEYLGFEGCSLFIKWIAVNGASLGYRAFYFVWPILAAMPFGWSYSAERKSGVYNQIVSRTGARHYYMAKYMAVFVSGGLAVAVPVLLNLLVNALVCPAVIPRVQSSLVTIFDGNFLSKLFYTHPWIHGLIWCVVDFLWGGAAAGLCFLIGARLRHQVMVMLTPFALLVVLDGVYTMLRNMTGLTAELSPLNLAAAAGANPNPEWAVFTVMGVLVVCSFIAGWRQVVKHELV